MRQSRGETLGHGPGPPLAAMRDVQCVQMGIAVSAHSQARVCVWPPCAFAPATRVRGSFFCAFSEGLRCGTAPDDVGVASRGFTRARLARTGWGFQRALRGLDGLKRLDAWVPNV